jgi:hypothetical protein
MGVGFDLFAEHVGTDQITPDHDRQEVVEEGPDQIQSEQAVEADHHPALAQEQPPFHAARAQERIGNDEERDQVDRLYLYEGIEHLAAIVVEDEQGG